MELFEKTLSSMNKGYKTEYTGFNQFTSVQLEKYLKHIKNKNKDLEEMVNRVDEMEEK